MEGDQLAENREQDTEPLRVDRDLPGWESSELFLVLVALQVFDGDILVSPHTHLETVVLESLSHLFDLLLLEFLLLLLSNLLLPRVSLLPLVSGVTSLVLFLLLLSLPRASPSSTLAILRLLILLFLLLFTVGENV